MEQFVFFCAKDSVAAVKIESSNLGADDAEVVVFGVGCHEVVETFDVREEELVRYWFCSWWRRL